MRAAGWIFAAATVFVWGVTFANTRALLVDFSPLEIHILRFALAWAILATVTLFCRLPWRSAGANDELLFAAMGLAGVAVYQLLENCAIYYTSASNVAILISFGPIVTALLARVFAKDRTLTMRFVAGALVAVCGVAFVSADGLVNFKIRPMGDVMALVATVSWGVYSVLLDKANKRGYPQIVVIRKTFFWALAILAPLALWGATPSGFYALDGSFSIDLDGAVNRERFSSFVNLLNLFFLGALASALAFVMWNKACKALGMVRTSLGLYLIPLVGIVFACAFLGERLSWMSCLGGLAIVSGVAIANCNLR